MKHSINYTLLFSYHTEHRESKGYWWIHRIGGRNRYLQMIESIQRSDEEETPCSTWNPLLLFYSWLKQKQLTNTKQGVVFHTHTHSMVDDLGAANIWSTPCPLEQLPVFLPLIGFLRRMTKLWFISVKYLPHHTNVLIFTSPHIIL